MGNEHGRRTMDGEFQRSLGRIEGKLETLETKVDDVKDYTRDVSERVRSLEVSRGWAIGTGTAAGAFGAWLLNLFR